MEAGKRSTLPFLNEQWIQGFLKAYASVFDKQPIS
jgi:hypothetical protein